MYARITYKELYFSHGSGRLPHYGLDNALQGVALIVLNQAACTLNTASYARSCKSIQTLPYRETQGIGFIHTTMSKIGYHRRPRQKMWMGLGVSSGNAVRLTLLGELLASACLLSIG
jgi:hypothetical protein